MTAILQIAPGKADDATRVNRWHTAQSSTINDSNFPPGCVAVAVDVGSSVICAGWKRVVIVPRFTGGSAPTVVIQPLHRFGTGWALGTKTSALLDGQMATIEVFGRLTYFRVDTIDACTTMGLYCGGVEAYRPDCPRV